jgi:hypothetical protein
MPSFAPIFGALFASALMTPLAAAQTLPPPPASTAPPSIATVPTAKPVVKPKPKPKPVVSKRNRSYLSCSILRARRQHRHLPRHPRLFRHPLCKRAPLPASAGKFDARQRAVIERVSNYLSNLRTLVGEFKQVAPDGSRTAGDFHLLKTGPRTLRLQFAQSGRTDRRWKIRGRA